MDGELDLSRFCCQNERCVAYGRSGQGNLTTSGYSDKGKTLRMLRCRTCKKRFSCRKGTVFFRLHLPQDEGVDILRHVAEGNGMRQTGRLTGHKEETVIRLVRQAGRHAQHLHEQLVAFSPSHPGGAGR